MNNSVFTMIKKYAGQLAQMEGWEADQGKILVILDDILYETRTGCDFGNLQEADVAVLAGDGAGDSGEPETTLTGAALAGVTLMEANLLRKNPEMGAMVLSQTRYCQKAAERGEPVSASLDDMAQIVGAKAETVADDVARIESALRESAACFVKGKYTICTGRSLFEAVTALQVLEKQAEVHLKAQVLGGSVAVACEEAAFMRRNYLRHYSKAEHAVKSKEGRTSHGADC